MVQVVAVVVLERLLSTRDKEVDQVELSERQCLHIHNDTCMDQELDN